MSLEGKMKYNFDFAVKFNRWSMQLCGLWPIEDRFSNLRFYFTLIFLLFITVPAIVQCFYLNNLFQEVETIFVTINLILTLFKAIFIGRSKQKLLPVINNMIDDWNLNTLSKESKCLMIFNSKHARFLNKLCLTFMYGPCIIFIIRPLLRCGVESTKKCLPCPAYYPFDVEKSPNYEIIYLMQAFLITCLVTVAMSSNTYLTVIVYHLCGQLQILALSVKDIVNQKNLSSDESIISEEEKCLNNFVERHLKLIRQSEILESSFNILFLIEVVIMVLTLCFMGFAVLVVSPGKNISETLINIAYFLVTSFMIFSENSIGENLINRSMEIADAVYNTNWYDCNPKLIRSLILIIIRSQRPLKFTAGKFFPLSLFTFKKILMSAVSYAAVLLASSRKHRD